MKTTVRHWHLEYVHDGSRKFYTVWLNEDESEIWLSWGRIGTSGQSELKLFHSSGDAKAKALAQVYAKQSKGYTLKREDYVFEVEDSNWSSIERIRRDFAKALTSGDASPREAALNYIEGFVSDCNEFLMSAKEGVDPDDLQPSFEDLSTRWEELKDKFDSAETMMHMVKMRTLKRV